MSEKNVNMCKKPKQELKWTQLSIKCKIDFVIRNITVEPMLACYIIPCVLSQLANQNLSLEKACRVNLQYSDKICNALMARQTENYTQEETHVQQLVAGMAIWRTFVQSAIPGLLIMFLGSWSDRRRRRKPFMLLPIVGEFLSSSTLIVCTYFFYELPMEVAGFFECFFPALTGGWMAMNMAVFSYLGDITSVENRTLRIGIVNIFCTAGIPIGLGLSGIYLKAVGFYGVFFTSAFIFIGSFIFCVIYVQDVNTDLTILKVQESSLNCHLDKPTDEISPNRTTCFLKDFFDLKHIGETFAVVFKTGSKIRRKRIMLLVVVLIVVIGPIHGEMTVIYLFMRYRFNWDEVQFSLFSTYSVITHLIGTSFSVGVLSHMLKIDDALIGVMSCMSKILASFVYAFAQTEWQVYLAPLVDIVNGTSFIAMRSITSKLVPPEELGKLNSLYGACESLTPLLYGPMYAFVYAQTMDAMPGAFFILGGVLTMPAVIIFGWMYMQHRGDRMRMQTSRKSSVAEDVLTNLRVDLPRVMTPTILDLPDNQSEEKATAGKINPEFQEEINIP